MSKGTKIALFVAAALVITGGILFVGALMTTDWDFTKTSPSSYVTNRYDLTESFQRISIETDTADVRLVPSTDDTAAVECYEHKRTCHQVSVEDGCLSIEFEDYRKWYEYIGIHFDTPQITVTIPQGAYESLSVSADTGAVELPKGFAFHSADVAVLTGDVTAGISADELSIATTTGDILVNDVSAGSLALAVDTGRVTVANVTCKNAFTLAVDTGKAAVTNVTCQSFASSGDTGDIALKNTVAREALSIERTTGDVTLEACDAATLDILTDTGDVRGSLQSDKVFIAKSDTGRIHVPHTTTGGKCEITTDTGDIRLEIQK